MSSSNSASSSSMLWRPAFTPNCLHGFPADILTSHTTMNPNRKFFCCSLRQHDDCDFFQWLDAPSPASFCRNNCNRRCQLEISMYEAKLEKRILSESVAIAELKLKNEELEALKLKLKQAEAWKKWCCAMLVFVGLAVAIGIGKTSA